MILVDRLFIQFDWADTDFSWQWHTDRGHRRIEPLAVAFHQEKPDTPWILNIIVGPICINAAWISKEE